MLPKIDSFYERLAYARSLSGRNLRWSDIAEATGISKTNFSRYKRGDYLPSGVTLLRIAHLLGVDADWLAGDDIDITDCGLPLLTNLYESLNKNGREKLIEYAEYLLAGHGCTGGREE